MNTLIKITEKIIDQETVQTVNARDLHAFLESKQDFSTWIKNASLLILFLKGKILSASTKKWKRTML